MEKKIYDIFPPAGAEVQPKEPPKAFKLAEKFYDKKPVAKPAAKVSRDEWPDKALLPSKPFPKKRLIVFLIVFAVLAASIWSFYLYFPKARITVWLKTEIVSAENQVSISKDIKTVDSKTGSLPGRVVTEKQTLSLEFPATGKILKEEKSEGKIIIYNDFSANSQPLVATTRLVSSEGKLFRLVERVVVPGQTTENNKTISGSIEARVRADSAGEAFNIGPTTFSIPGFAGTPKYTAFYAKSSVSMTGGFKGEVEAVTAKDLDDAKAASELKIGEKIDEALESRTLPGITVAKSSHLQITKEQASATVGQAVKSFSYQIEASKDAVLVAQDDLKELAKSYLFAKLDEKQNILMDSLKIDIVVKDVDTASAKASLALTMSSKAYNTIDSQALEASLLGKPMSEVQKDFQSMEEVSRARIEIIPSFFRALPETRSKIQLKIDFE
jgi:hypothetical protein